MTERVRQREKIVRATAKLLRRRGYSATGLAEIIALSKSPKGSLYHYFPDGKEQIAAEAIKYAGSLLLQTLLDVAANAATPGDMVRRYGRLLAGWMKQSGFRDGCPITTTMLETAPEKEELTRLGREIFEQWAEIYVDALERAGVARGRAHELSTFATIAIEGSLILARVMQSGDPVLLAANEVARLFDREAKAAQLTA